MNRKFDKKFRQHMRNKYAPWELDEMADKEIDTEYMLMLEAEDADEMERKLADAIADEADEDATEELEMMFHVQNVLNLPILQEDPNPDAEMAQHGGPLNRRLAFEVSEAITAEHLKDLFRFMNTVKAMRDAQ